MLVTELYIAIRSVDSVTDLLMQWCHHVSTHSMNRKYWLQWHWYYWIYLWYCSIVWQCNLKFWGLHIYVDTMHTTKNWSFRTP